jgi:WD40 repeat protein
VIAWTVRWCVVLVFASACSFRLPAGEPAGEDGALAPPDSGSDAIGPCVQKWLAGPTFVAPAPLAALNTALSENDAFVTTDELTLFFAREGDIYVSTRLVKTDDFAIAAIDPLLSSPELDSKLSLTADGLTVYLNTNRPSGGDTDVLRGTRTVLGGAFAFSKTFLGTVDTSANQWDPEISADELRLYLAPDDTGLQHVAVAERATVADDFGAPVTIPELASTTTDNDPTISADERVIVFASNRNGRGLWYATRAERTQAFSAPQELVDINSTQSDDGPHLTADGCHLYFSSSRNGSDDLYVAALR